LACFTNEFVGILIVALASIEYYQNNKNSEIKRDVQANKIGS